MTWPSGGSWLGFNPVAHVNYILFFNAVVTGVDEVKAVVAK